MCRSLQVAKLDLIGGIEAMDSHRKLDLKELVGLGPDHLRSRGLVTVNILG